MFSKSLMKHFKRFDSGFTELHAKLDADTLLDFATHNRQKKPEVEKAIRVRSVVSHGRLTQQACRTVTLASPLIFHRGSYNNNSPGNF
jgi:hypothetical protein